MRSQLTRSVFGRLLSNEGYIPHCPSRRALSARISNRHASPCIVRPPCRRTLFGFFHKAPRQHKDPALAPGLTPMVDFSVMDKLKARPPPAQELVKAWRIFFQHKVVKKESLDTMEAGHVLRVFKHLQELDSEFADCRLSMDDLRLPKKLFQDVRGRSPKIHNVQTAELVRGLYGEWVKSEGQSEGVRQKDLHLLIRVLTRSGNTAEARDLLEAQTFESDINSVKTQRLCWKSILRGFALEDNEAELLKTARRTEEREELVYYSAKQNIMTEFYAARNDTENTKLWYWKPLVTVDGLKKSGQPDPKTLSAVLRYCIRNDESEWCKLVFRDVLESDPDKPTWDVVLQWASGVMGKGVEDVERMMKVIIRRSNDENPVTPDIVTINGLVEMSMSLNDSYLAERYIALGEKFGIKPNGNTYILQMKYRADANDLRGAQEAYDRLQAEEVENDDDLPAINTFLRALCASKLDNYNRITSIVSDLDERDKRLEADTVSALTKLYLHRDEIHELIDLLQTQSYKYTVEERLRIIKTMMDYSLNPETTTVRSWECYTIFRQVFDELNLEQRTTMMNEYFRRGRCDMACHAFGHMRQHSMLPRRPVLSTYVSCFEGIASLADREMLDMVHNMLKMDSSIEPNTKLYNSLMLAYTACDDADRALDFWDDITNTEEGPSYKSLEIVFWACGKKPFGDRKARDIWGKMRRMEIEVTPGVFRGYVSALAGQGKFEETRDMCEGMEKEFSLKLDVETLGTFYNSIPGQSRKDLVEEWAKGLSPDIWRALCKLGQTTQEEGHRLFNMTREMKA
ncbi:related to complex I intermediate-associated protein 84, mitochondrial precursor [Rhynchosporium agropyri]|uniref:Related to complex I intermediate-associated protein 84, mitochondrial n=1 Tax=Rhynchosporium agropyri TaxID=914238 RepID=A0A1E1LPF4_9HELO|nr:related to complex I intermediate-associated protein 84, mitochondrial precursor [Rhynchosporium agropyri]